MAGIAQVWLTGKELDALLHAARTKGATVSDSVWLNGLEDKLLAAYGGVACATGVNRHKPESPFTTPKIVEIGSGE